MKLPYEEWAEELKNGPTPWWKDWIIPAIALILVILALAGLRYV